ncbi:class A beta-lactamase [Carnimonas bestiolae]|uniref:class A beta-lactamase n=1 Tax=Carnimonas bestiolae TaxID=3402172 RepID=UPI003EDBF3F3
MRWLFGCCWLLAWWSAASADTPPADPLGTRAYQLEQRLGGRIGVYVIDTERGRSWQYRADQRFPMASTFKVVMCAALLDNLERHHQPLSSPSPTLTKQQLVTHSPVTARHVGQRLSMGKLCSAALTVSDNTAANLVLNWLGGPQYVTRYARSLGDQVTRLDRFETQLNEAAAGDERDTTSPHAMALSLQHLLIGDALPNARRQQLIQWMNNDQVADELLRAVVPHDWQVADKTGAGANNTRNIVALLKPPHRKPVIVTIYMTEAGLQMEQQDTAIRALGRSIVRLIAAD